MNTIAVVVGVLAAWCVVTLPVGIAFGRWMERRR
jgi:hypothetical protein